MSIKAVQMGEARRRAEAVRSLRALRATAPSASPAPAPAPVLLEHCDFCGVDLTEDHRHMLDLSQRAILCACEPCLAMKAGRDDLRPTGIRTVFLDDFDMPDHIWAAFAIPVGLAFILRSSGIGRMVALYPSPAGATECELELTDWDELVELNPALADLETDIEALIVDRMSDEHRYVIAPIDQCYKLVGMIKSNWSGISGGDAIERAIPAFFEELRG
jgi:hypothetical protein